MRKLLWAFLLLLVPFGLQAQVTASITSYFKIPKRYMAIQSVGLPLDAAYCAGDPDTLQQIDIVVTALDSIYVSAATTYEVFRFDVRAVDPISGRERSYTYYDTLRCAVQHIIPYTTQSSISDSLFYITLGDSISTGDSFRLILQPIQEVRLMGDTLTTKPEFSVTADSLNTF